MTDYLDGTARALAGALARREVSAAEIMAATLERVAARNYINAIVDLRDPGTLMAEARDKDTQGPRGPLHGIPIAVKDLSNVAGLRTTRGSPLFADQIATGDDIMVARMRAAGAIFIGKTNTPEFGLGSHTFNPVHGATGNAYDPARSAGGSSGGAAAALAARMVVLADGSDMMGSLRNPAAWGNVYGFRPSWGLVPSEPQGDTFLHQLSTAGPMARSVEDLALLLQVQAGTDPRQPHGTEPGDYLGGLDREIGGLRIGWLGDWGGAYAMEAGILDLCRAALGRMEEMGAIVEDVPPPFDAAHLWQAWVTLRSWCVAGGSGALYDDPQARALLKPAAIWEIEQGRALSAMAVHEASVIRSEWFARARELFHSHDALILPTAQVWPFPLDRVHPETINGQVMDTYHRWMEVVVPVSLIGLPSLNVPVGFGAGGLPMGMQIFGPRGADKAVLQIGQAWHRATGWPDRRPPPGAGG